LSEADIIECCEKGYDLGFRTFVLQGGEDPWFNEKRIEGLVKGIKERFGDCAVTLSVGEHPKETYQRWFEAGADRFLLRHETADDIHYRALHPEELTLENRKRCLYDLKEIGYQVGCGFMVGSPFQKTEHIVKDLLFIREFSTDMVGIGPFIPCKNTPFEKEKAGTLELTVFLLAVVRLMNPTVLLPATTALASIDPLGREKGILAGANVCMPNLSPQDVRDKYNLYDGKVSSGSEAAEALVELSERVKKIGYNIVISRGDRIKA
jgi:biotin synthase